MSTREWVTGNGPQGEMRHRSRHLAGAKALLIPLGFREGNLDAVAGSSSTANQSSSCVCLE